MTIFLMCNRLDEIGGVQRVVRTLADCFISSGNRVELIDIGGSDEPYRIVTAFKPIEHRLFGTSKSLRILSRSAFIRKRLTGTRAERTRFFEKRRAMQRLRALLFSNPACVCIAMDVFAAELLAKVAPDETTIIFQYHNSHSAIAGTRDAARVRRLASQFDAMVALTKDDADAFSKANAGQWYFIDNPLPYEATVSDGLRENLIITVGRFTQQKAFHILLQAWAHIEAEVPNWKLEVVGSGPEEGRIRDLIRELGLRNVSVHPPTNNIPRLLSRASIYALSSRYEGLPMVLIEALAFRVPVVATDCSPGVRQLVSQGHGGLLCPVGDTETFAAHLLRLIRQPNLRKEIGDAGSKSVERYRQPCVTAAWLELIANLRSRKKQ
ncbi:MAG: glycosyltransferase [Alphaproteobacteria bacterium]|nr:glycosyltransferase [Alphaproteobacteria bacterium]OJU58059.1 MAG: hypothetical protein BGO00_06095 [Alphaproteobacteria bacterium 62-8]